jgi:uncharacterized repeat protein (TIGR01451 family)
VQRLISSILLIAGLLTAPAATAQVAGTDLSASARAEPATAPVGENVKLVAGVTNAGPDQATDVVLTVTLPPGLVAQSVDGSPAPCTLQDPIECRIGPLPSGSSANVRITVAITHKGTSTATVNVSAKQADPVPTNNQALADVTGTGESCQRTGTIESDVLRAGKDGNVVCGLGGDDTLLGGPRGDVLLGGDGADSLVGDAGHDRLDGGAGADACVGDPGSGSERLCEHAIFGLAGTLPLVELTAATVGYGYHQSLFGSAIGVRPFGEHVVMSSRNRGTGSTTAADIVMPSGARVRAPVTGDVVTVKRYLLYCERPDWKVVIRPDSDPSLRVLILHLGQPGVEKGEEVTGGVSRLGRARPMDWSDSQKNHYFPARYPHVHVEVERDRASPTPGCSI